MTNEQALKVLEEATAMLTLNRKDHQTVITALQTLANAVAATAKPAAPAAAPEASAESAQATQ
jgi:hypothetical protein